MNLEWVNDGHKLKLEIDHDAIIVAATYCPHKGAPGVDCWNKEADGCIVAWFLRRYGLACNKGKAPAHSVLPVVWAIAGDGEHLASSQVWVLPKEDEAFSAWFQERGQETGATGLPADT